MKFVILIVIILLRIFSTLFLFFSNSFVFSRMFSYQKKDFRITNKSKGLALYNSFTGPSNIPPEELKIRKRERDQKYQSSDFDGRKFLNVDEFGEDRFGGKSKGHFVPDSDSNLASVEGLYFHSISS